MEVLSWHLVIFSVCTRVESLVVCESDSEALRAQTLTSMDGLYQAEPH